MNILQVSAGRAEEGMQRRSTSHATTQGKSSGHGTCPLDKKKTKKSTFAKTRADASTETTSQKTRLSRGRWASLRVLFDFMDQLGHQIGHEDESSSS